MATITSYPQVVDFSAPGATMPGAGGSVAVQPNGALLITLPPGGQSEGGYSQHDLPPTKTLHVRQRITALAPLPSCKWLIAMRSNTEGVEQTGCRRFIVQSNPYLNGRFVPWPTQGVCSSQRDAQDNFIVSDFCDFDWNQYINQEVSLEYAADLNTGTYSVYVSTPDGRYSNALFMQIALATGAPFNPSNNQLMIEQMPSPDFFTALRPMYWNNASPAGTQCILHEMVVSDTLIGNPYSAPVPAPTPDPVPTPVPAPSVLAPTYTGGRFHVFVNGVEVSWHSQEKEAYEAAGRAILTDPLAVIEINTDTVRVTLE